MNDDLNELDQVLREKASEVPYFQKAPRKLIARARRRVARNALASIVVAGLVVAGASTGLAGLRADRVPPASSLTPPTTSCTAPNLRAVAALQGAAGSVEGSLQLTNLGDKTCTLEGRPKVMLFESSGRPLSVSDLAVPPQWQAHAASPPAGWPVVRLSPGAVASIRVRWSNPCPQLSDPAFWRVSLPEGRGTLDVLGADATSPPPCNGPTQPSTLEVGPFEPGTNG